MTTELIVTALISAFGPMLWWYKDGHRVTPDGKTLLGYVGGRTPVNPFHTRVGLIWLFRLVPKWREVTIDGDTVKCQQSLVKVWFGLSMACVSLSALFLGMRYGPIAATLFVLSPWARNMVSWYTTQTDQPALVLGTLALLLSPEVGNPTNPAWVALVCAIGALFHERVPVLAAVWTWNPYCLVGLLPYLVLRLLIKPGSSMSHEAEIVDKPWQSARKASNQFPLYYHIVPLGLFWLGALGSIQCALAVGLAYAQCLVAWDRVRLYSWAIPFLLPGTIAVLATLEPGVAVLLSAGCLVAMHSVAERLKY